MEYLYVTDNTEYKGEYFYIIKQENKNRKTPIYHIFNFDTNFLGDIRWFAKWRRYCFFPYNNTVWDIKCLRDVQEQLERINIEYKSGGVGN